MKAEQSKGGTPQASGVVRRLGWAMDPRSFKVYPIAAPLSLNEANTTCNAFGRSFPSPFKSSCSTGLGTDAFWSTRWKDLPASGDGSEATRKSIIRTNDGRRRHSACECFLHTTPAEQIRRFKDRLTNPLKRWKLSYEDFRNRSRSADYDAAIEEMMDKGVDKTGPMVLGADQR